MPGRRHHKTAEIIGQRRITKRNWCRVKYERAFAPRRLCNWEVPRVLPSCLPAGSRAGPLLADQHGRLLAGARRAHTQPPVLTNAWEYPNKITQQVAAELRQEPPPEWRRSRGRPATGQEETSSPHAEEQHQEEAPHSCRDTGREAVQPDSPTPSHQHNEDNHSLKSPSADSGNHTSTLSQKSQAC